MAIRRIENGRKLNEGKVVIDETTKIEDETKNGSKQHLKYSKK